MKFDALGKSKDREGKSLTKIFLLYLSVHWGDLIEQIKKNCRIHFNWFQTVNLSFRKIDTYQSLFII